MRIAVLGGNGMAGHVIAANLRRSGHEVTATVRRSSSGAGGGAWRLEGVAIRELDARDMQATEVFIAEAKPDVIVNAIGVLNAQAEAQPLDAYTVNGLLPHWLAHLGSRAGARLIHISSDCVFSGDRGGYAETEAPDGRSVYAKTKALGEVRDRRHLTIRTSIIGHEIREGGIGLLQWFLAQRGEVAGYVNVPWNGVTTLELARAIEWAIGHPQVGGLVHLTAPEPIRKRDLLELLRLVYDKRDVTIVPADEPVIDRTLLPTATAFGYRPPDYPTMLTEMREWETERWR